MPQTIHRTLTPERMDRDDVPVDQLRRSLAFIRGVNRCLGGTRAVLCHLKRFSRVWSADQRIHILDIATGSADIPLAIVRWGRRAGHDMHVTALDRHESTLALAAEHVRGEDRIRLVRADALSPPFEPRSFDYVVSSMFLHHLDNDQVVQMLRTMDRLAARGVVWNDLTRAGRAYWWCRLLTLPSSAIVKHDGPVSVLAGFRRREVLAVANRLGLHHLRFRRHFAHRFTLAGQR